MKKFDDFLDYLGNNEEKWMDFFKEYNGQYHFNFSTSNDESLENFVFEIAKMNKDITINLLKMYHEWLSK